MGQTGGTEDVGACHVMQALSRGILCNWLVSAAVWMANAASSAPGKAVAVWFPISAFVALGLEHSVIPVTLNTKT